MNARAAGGHLIHIVETEGRALCGFKPGSVVKGLGRQMKTRAAWYVSAYAPTCSKCLDKKRAQADREGPGL